MIAILRNNHVSGHDYEIGHLETVRDLALFIPIGRGRFSNLRTAVAEAKKHGPLDRTIYMKDLGKPYVRPVQPGGSVIK